VKIVPGSETLGARIEEINLSDGLTHAEFVQVLRALGEHGVLCFPNQDLETGDFATFGRMFGDLAVNIANDLHAPGLPEVMILSNMVEDGKPLGLADAGQGWHTDQSYSHEVALANILIADKVPRRGGKVLGNTQFLNMHAAYEGLPDEVKGRLDGKTATHDFEKFWEVMRKRPGSRRQPMTAEQKAKKPPVSHPVFRTHPLTGRRVLYCNPGYAIRIDGMDADESDEMLEFLFEHQMRDEYLYAHNWTEGDVLMWDNIGTVHNAVADYGPDEHRYMRRVQVMATMDYESILGA